MIALVPTRLAPSPTTDPVRPAPSTSRKESWL